MSRGKMSRGILACVLAFLAVEVFRNGPLFTGVELGADDRVLVAGVLFLLAVGIVPFFPSLLKLGAIVVICLVLTPVVLIGNLVIEWAENYRAGHGGIINWMVEKVGDGEGGLPARIRIESKELERLRALFGAAGRPWDRHVAGEGVIVDEGGRVIELMLTGDDLKDADGYTRGYGAVAHLCTFEHLRKVKIRYTELGGFIPTCLLESPPLQRLRQSGSLPELIPIA